MDLLWIWYGLDMDLLAFIGERNANKFELQL